MNIAKLLSMSLLGLAVFSVTRAQTAPPPKIDTILNPDGYETGAAPGEEITIKGSGLKDVSPVNSKPTVVVFPTYDTANPDVPKPVEVVVTSPAANEIKVKIPGNGVAGALIVQLGTGAGAIKSASVPLAVRFKSFDFFPGTLSTNYGWGVATPPPIHVGGNPGADCGQLSMYEPTVAFQMAFGSDGSLYTAGAWMSLYADPASACTQSPPQQNPLCRNYGIVDATNSLAHHPANLFQGVSRVTPDGQKVVQMANCTGEGSAAEGSHWNAGKLSWQCVQYGANPNGTNSWGAPASECPECASRHCIDPVATAYELDKNGLRTVGQLPLDIVRASRLMPHRDFRLTADQLRHRCLHVLKASKKRDVVAWLRAILHSDDPGNWRE